MCAIIDISHMENGNEPATKADLNELRGEMKAMEDRLVEAIRDSQTEVLRAVYGFAQTNSERLTTN